MKRAEDLDERIGRMAATWHEGVTPLAAAPCPDAAELAEWLENPPGSSSRAALDGHLASCTRCQQVMAVLVKAEPPDPQVRPLPAADRRRRMLLSWFLPAAATTAAAVIWLVVRPTVVTPPAKPLSSASHDATVAAGAEAEVRPPLTGAVGGVAKPTADERDRQQQTRPTSHPQTLQTEVPSDALRLAPSRRAATVEQQNEVKAATPPREATPPAGVLAGVAGVPEPRPQAALPGAPAVELQTLGRARAADVAAPPPAMPVKMEKVSAEAVAADLIVVSASDERVRWRLGSGGLVERTVDAGATWVRTEGGASRAVLAGSAPSPTVCWLVGRNGLVLRTRDGLHFEPVPSPLDTDLVAVEATDARTAAVTSADGRVYRTSDGGSSWQR